VSELPINKSKIINDPVYGFINIPFEIVFDLIEHPYFQRLRRIKQLGFTNFVYPAANHTRFQHALGATYLMSSAIQIIRSKGHEISEEEAEAVTIAILLHDIGHGPFSHSLENSIIEKTGKRNGKINNILENLLISDVIDLNPLYFKKISLNFEDVWGYMTDLYEEFSKNRGASKNKEQNKVMDFVPVVNEFLNLKS